MMDSLSPPPNSNYMSEFFSEIENINKKIEAIERDVDRARMLHSRVIASPTNDTGRFIIRNKISSLSYCVKAF
jgi:hypothetical protein